MKKLLGFIVVLVGLLVLPSLSHSATPQGYRPDRAWSASVFQGSTATATSFNNTGGISVAISSVGVNGQNCLEFVEVEMPIQSTFTILDGGLSNTTALFTKFGSTLAVSSATSNTGSFSHQWATDAPLCGSANTTMTLTVPASASNTTPVVINYEGYVPPYK